jgi:hypothetical protein
MLFSGHKLDDYVRTKNTDHRYVPLDLLTIWGFEVRVE